jgi:AraC family transcriptional regulator, transcriptional activator FtrA
MNVPRLNLATGVHRVAVVVLPGVVMLDLTVPLQMFGPWPESFLADEPGLTNPYEVVLCGPEPAATSGSWLALTGLRPMEAALDADTVIVPGCEDPLTPLPPNVAPILAEAAARGTRMVSICLGAFPLAAAGILDGRRATTHWRWAAQLRADYPLVDVQERHLYVDEGRVLTSAGVLAGADLCLHILRRDLGQSSSNAVARFLVSAPHREGGQAQFIREPVTVESGSLAPTRQWLLQTLGEEHTLRAIAAHARVSVRTLTRRFQAETGETVMGWLTRQRLARARALLEDTDRPIGDIACDTGFGSLEALRFHFHAGTGTSPQSYRRTFRGTPAQAS